MFNLSFVTISHTTMFSYSLYSPYFWIETVYFCISCWALYCLAIFFVVARHDLAPVKPLSKFLLVKGIVFFTWAQTLAISLAFYFVYDYKVYLQYSSLNTVSFFGHFSFLEEYFVICVTICLFVCLF